MPRTGKQIKKRPPEGALPWFGVAVAIILSLPTFGLPFLWDDFDFLARARIHDLWNLLPAPADPLYRPVSRDVYFSLVDLLSQGSPVVAHAMNAALVAMCFLLLISFIRKFSSLRAGLVGGFIFSTAAAIPFLVGWISGSQDLLCILFSLGAYHLFARGRVVLGSVLFAAALFSKETAVALFPAVIAIPLFAAPDRRRETVRIALALLLVLAAWAGIHPWVRGCIVQGKPATVNTYVAFRGWGALSGILNGLPSLFNLSLTWNHVWRVSVVAFGVLGTVFLWIGMRRTWQDTLVDSDVESRVLPIVGALTAIGPFLFTSAFIAHWSVYYAGVSIAGISMLAAPTLSRAPRPLATLVIATFLWLGVLSRMAVVPAEVPAEQNLFATAPVLQRIERELKVLEPTLPRGARVYVYVQAAGTHGGYDSIYKNQPLKVWYSDSSLEVRDPLHLLPAVNDEFLFWISPKVDVFSIDPRTLQARSPGPAASFPEYQKALRAFALGLAGRGEIDRAVSVLTGMLQFSDYLKAYDHRSAAAILYAARRDQEADRILVTTPSFARGNALAEIAGLIAKPVPGIDLDEGALRAFGIAPTDTSAVREIMRSLERQGYRESSKRFAVRLLGLVPRDPEATRIRLIKPTDS